MQEQIPRMGIRLNHRGNQPHHPRHAENQIAVAIARERWNHFRVEHSIRHRGNRQEKSHQRPGSADIEQRARGTYRRTNQDERAECPYQRRRGNKHRVAGADVVIPAGEVMPQFVRQQNRQQRDREGKAGQKCGGMAIGESERLQEGVNRGSLIVRIGSGEMRARQETRDQRKEKQKRRKDERTSWRDAEELLRKKARTRPNPASYWHPEERERAALFPVGSRNFTWPHLQRYLQGPAVLCRA